jgi:hypothetical protein
VKAALRNMQNSAGTNGAFAAGAGAKTLADQLSPVLDLAQTF